MIVDHNLKKEPFVVIISRIFCCVQVKSKTATTKVESCWYGASLTSLLLCRKKGSKSDSFLANFKLTEWQIGSFLGGSVFEKVSRDSCSSILASVVMATDLSRAKVVSFFDDLFKWASSSSAYSARPPIVFWLWSCMTIYWIRFLRAIKIHLFTIANNSHLNPLSVGFFSNRSPTCCCCYSTLEGDTHSNKWSLRSSSQEPLITDQNLLASRSSHQRRRRRVLGVIFD